MRWCCKMSVLKLLLVNSERVATGFPHVWTWLCLLMFPQPLLARQACAKKITVTIISNILNSICIRWKTRNLFLNIFYNNKFDNDLWIKSTKYYYVSILKRVKLEKKLICFIFNFYFFEWRIYYVYH